MSKADLQAKAMTIEQAVEILNKHKWRERQDWYRDDVMVRSARCAELEQIVKQQMEELTSANDALVDALPVGAPDSPSLSTRIKYLGQALAILTPTPNVAQTSPQAQDRPLYECSRCERYFTEPVEGECPHCRSTEVEVEQGVPE